jgi:phosphoenolpyruvate phosphomutase
VNTAADNRPRPAPAELARQLRALLAGPRCSYLLEAHNAVSARIAEEAGAPGVWASSLTLSCSIGLPDNSEITMTQALEILESMTASVGVPILFDGDTGYGEFSHFQLLVRRLWARGVAGVCIEDKVFPKRNSFLRSEAQELATVEEFCGKLRAGCDARPCPEFVIVARTEALIAGLGMEAALGRARAYAEAGADAVLVHSKAPTATEVLEFARRWDRPVPLVCVPTTYYSTPVEAFERAGVHLVIWANHMMRAAIEAMQRVAARIAASGSAREVEELVVPVRELFRLQGVADREKAERRYALASSRTRAVILAASRGAGLDGLTADRPKCMIPVDGVPILEKLLQHLRAEGVRDITVVRGYQAEAVCPPGVRLRDNPRWAETGELGSLAVAREDLCGDVLLVYGDVLFKRYVLHELLAAEDPLTIVVDGSRFFVGSGRPVDRVRVSAPAPRHYDERRHTLLAIGQDAVPEARADGEWIGLLRARGPGAASLARALDEALAAPGGEALPVDALLGRLVAAGEEIRVLYIQRDWADVDSLADIAQDAVR